MWVCVSMWLWQWKFTVISIVMHCTQYSHNLPKCNGFRNRARKKAHIKLAAHTGFTAFSVLKSVQSKDVNSVSHRISRHSFRIDTNYFFGFFLFCSIQFRNLGSKCGHNTEVWNFFVFVLKNYRKWTHVYVDSTYIEILCSENAVLR